MQISNNFSATIQSARKTLSEEKLKSEQKGK